MAKKTTEKVGAARKGRTRDDEGRRPGREAEEGDVFAQRAEWMRRLLGDAAPGDLAREIEHVRARKGTMTALPRRSADRGGPLPESGVEVVGEGAERITALFGKNPGKRATWGRTGRYVRVKAKAKPGSARLRFRLGKKAVAHLHPTSILVARWDAGAGRFFVIPQSGYDGHGGYAYARITRPGTYTAVGLPRDPRLLTTLQLMSDMRPWIRMGGKEGRRFRDRICQAMLCPDVMGSRPNAAKKLAAVGLASEDLSGGYGGGSACAQCLSLEPDRLPELDILNLAAYESLAHRTLDVRIADFGASPPPAWTNLGPVNFTGRVTALAIHPGDGNTLYAGTAGGGVWKTADGGASWVATMSREDSLAIGGLGIAASDPDVLYAATGEWIGGAQGIPSAIVGGAGVYRTRNGGSTWEKCGFIRSQRCSAVAVDPTNPERVFVAGDRAVHRSSDGGASWDSRPGQFDGVLDGEISDVAVDPASLDRIYCGVNAKGLFRSDNGGDDWRRLENGIATDSDAQAPKIDLGRRGAHGSQFVAVKMGNRVYTSIDGGDSFTRQADVDLGDLHHGTYGWANIIAIDPEEENILFAGDVDFYRSSDGGTLWLDGGSSVHADIQSLVFDPNDHNRAYVATDGGIWAGTRNAMNDQVTWTFASRGLVAAQVYVMGVSQTATLRYGGSVQDGNGLVSTDGTDWVSLGLGEGGYVEYDPSDERVIYHDTWHDTNLHKSVDGGGMWTDLGIDTDSDFAEALAISSQDANLLLALKNGGMIARARFGGVPGPNGESAWDDVLGPSAFSAIQFAPSDGTHAYAGTSTGEVWHSGGGGAQGTWASLGTPGPIEGKIQSIAVDWHDPLRFYVALGHLSHRPQDLLTRQLFRGDLDADGNVAWTNISGLDRAHSLPALPLTGLALHPALEDTVYVSTLSVSTLGGVFRSTDGGDSWAPFDDGLPNVFISDLDVRAVDRSLFASTMGRGIYRIFI